MIAEIVPVSWLASVWEPHSAELSFRAWADLLADTKSPAAKKGLWTPLHDPHPGFGFSI